MTSLLAGRLALLLALGPYLAAVALVAVAFAGMDMSSAAERYFIAATCTCVLALIIAIVLLVRRAPEVRGHARWALALSIVYLGTTGAIVGALTMLA
jgi:hypothetical protein